ncbi:hypothetical protein ITI46_16775 [Streptomyces oryzae]|uniref:Uncharacterized protein n=1 Tax=Streptomyces oryzae TaxID=1434886 RepID=A0ABS3XD96_9ACTN|nr:hypothetical protein [Streptomyces oryzae]MBO8193306.1 hypothetical protein [Streptomyces oryzae]
MGVTASFRSVTDQQMDRARQDPSYAARLLDETPEGDETPLRSNLSVQQRTFYIERFSLEQWEDLVYDAPVNVFLGEEYVDLNWDYGEEEEDDEEEEEGGEEEEDDGLDEDDGSQAMELTASLIAELADWLSGVRFEDVYDGPGQDEFLKGDFEEFRTFILAVAKRGEGALFHFA